MKFGHIEVQVLMRQTATKICPEGIWNMELEVIRDVYTRGI